MTEHDSSGRSRGVRTPSKPALGLDTDVTYLKGAGPVVAARLRALDLRVVRDLLFHLPLRHEDRRHFTPLADLRVGSEAQVRARVASAELRFGRRRMLTVCLEDEGGEVWLRFFNFNETQRAAFVAGRWVQAYGSVRESMGALELVHPQYRIANDPAELVTEATLKPVYPITAGLTQARLRTLIERALDIAASDDGLRTVLPGLDAPGQPDTLNALRALHFPADPQTAVALASAAHPLRLRLIREELLAHQLAMRMLRGRIRSHPARPLPAATQALEALLPVLPFVPTGAQRRVIAEVVRDLAGAQPMLRLVQGDVGSGKTVIAAAAMLAAQRAGLQSALVAPTELLAEQHLQTLSAWLQPLGVDLCLLSGRAKKAERAAVQARLDAGDPVVVVGTHAVFQSEVAFRTLTVVVVDEQHRFGVQQRLALRDKGMTHAPHQLILSATPIPRTLAQTLYADLDVSVLDELPPGRTPVQTVVMAGARRAELIARIRQACAQGRQAYWVCTLIEENEELDAEAAQATAQRLREELPQLSIGLVHGRLKPADKEAQMRAFKSGDTQLLVATTVIEVGVDVPNASIMVIENAERLGLAQLHQLRGRVGRGAATSQCVLLYQPPLGEMARARLATMRATTDGFVIAQRDLELRGPGELLGRRQTGDIGFRLADPLRDAKLIPPLQALADDWLRTQPALAQTLVRRWVGDPQRYAQV